MNATHGVERGTRAAGLDPRATRAPRSAGDVLVKYEDALQELLASRAVGIEPEVRRGAVAPLGRVEKTRQRAPGAPVADVLARCVAWHGEAREALDGPRQRLEALRVARAQRVFAGVAAEDIELNIRKKIREIKFFNSKRL